jgi:hypothetical protein
MTDDRAERIRATKRESAKRAYDRDPEKFRQRTRDRYANDPDAVKAASRRYYVKNRERLQAEARVRVNAKRAEDPEAARERSRARHRKGRAENPEEYAARRKAYFTKLRRDVIEGYGGRCACCGTDYLPHLTLDHVNGGGADERRAMSGRTIYTRLRRALPDLDPTYQVLCWNCNAAKHHLGRCACSDHP